MRAARTKRRAPLWAGICAVLGAVLMVVSGGLLATQQVLVNRLAAVEDDSLLGGSGGEAKSDIKGPLNILLVGIDPRDETTPPLADSIIVAHIPAGLETAYLFSLPRDLYVDIPGHRSGKINGAMSLGSQVGGGKPDVSKGFQLLAKTVSGVTGIERFDAGAIVNFGGFKSIVEAMGGVTMTIDQNIKSEHLAPDGKGRPHRPAFKGDPHPYRGPQKEYKKGTYHLEAWEALDVVRQRYTLKNGDYDRQRNQQRFVRAIAKQALSKDVVTNPGKLLGVLDAAGDSLTFSGGGHSVVDWALALRDVDPDEMLTISLPGGGHYLNGAYAGEKFTGPVDDFFGAVRSNTVPEFLLANPVFLKAASET